MTSGKVAIVTAAGRGMGAGHVTGRNLRVDGGLTRGV